MQQVYGYNPYANPYLQPYMTPAPQQPIQAPAQTGTGSVIHPVIHTDIAQVADRADAEAYPVGPGATQIMITKDDKEIYIKSATPDGYRMDIYVRQAPKISGQPDMSQYVTRDELAEMIKEIKGGGAKDEPV